MVWAACPPQTVAGLLATGQADSRQIGFVSRGDRRDARLALTIRVSDNRLLDLPSRLREFMNIKDPLAWSLHYGRSIKCRGSTLVLIAPSPSAKERFCPGEHCRTLQSLGITN
jgi:hypothetical protein